MFVKDIQASNRRAGEVLPLRFETHSIRSALHSSNSSTTSLPITWAQTIVFHTVWGLLSWMIKNGSFSNELTILNVGPEANIRMSFAILLFNEQLIVLMHHVILQ
jgi:hypothetical protein